MKYLSLLGSTGSIGTSVLDVVRQFPDQYRIVGLAAGRNVDLLHRQVVEFSPELISVLDACHADRLKALLPASYQGRIVWGPEGAVQVATLTTATMTISAIVGGAGLLPTLAAIEAGKDIGLANKETLVMAGKLVMAAAKRNNIQLLPVDSEHSAIFQALEAGHREDVAKIILTASGGPFLHTKAEELRHVTPDQALAHPNWNMGKKISVDSSTLMNKGLEVIEARWLFDMTVDAIEVVVHPQSIVHSLVEFQDGSVVAQLGIPDMRIPIAYALSYPRRLPLALKPLQLSQCGNLQFQEPDYERFPALPLAFQALRQGGVMPAVLNGANEVAVAAFLEGRLSFPGIVATVTKVMEQMWHEGANGSEDSLADILAADTRARSEAERLISLDLS
jgi:1-deoxy-D-xylulose-5-phosphate reductoisomerase